MTLYEKWAFIRLSLKLTSEKIEFWGKLHRKWKFHTSDPLSRKLRTKSETYKTLTFLIAIQTLKEKVSRKRSKSSKHYEANTNTWHKITFYHEDSKNVGKSVKAFQNLTK